MALLNELTFDIAPDGKRFVNIPAPETEDWLAETEWGKLFQSYSRGVPGPAQADLPVSLGRG